MDFTTLLYKYFSNSLTEIEQSQFNELLANNKEFKIQFEFEKNLKKGIVLEKSNDLRQKLNSFEEKYKQEKTIKKSSFSIFRIAASFAFLIAASYFGYQSFFASKSFEKLYADNYKMYPNTVYTITRADVDNSLERQAFFAYETEDYVLALKKFEEATPKKYFNFYKAQSYLKLHKLEEAKTLFKTIINNNQQFKAESNWYLALIYLKEKNTSEAKKYLQILTESYTYNKQKAESLLNELD